MRGLAKTVGGKRLSGLALAAAVALGGEASLAQTAAPEAPGESTMTLNPGPCLDAYRRQIKKDDDIVAAAQKVVNSKGYAALRPHIPRLRLTRR